MDIISQLIVNALITGSIYGLAAIGLALSFGVLKILNFAHGHFMMVGAYIFLLLVEISGWQLSPWWALLGTMVFMTILGALSLRCAILPFARTGFVLTLVSTLALSYIFESIIVMTFGVNTRSLEGNSFSESIEIVGAYITPLQIFIIVSALILFGAVGYILHLTRFGLSIRALSENARAADALGIPTGSIQYLVFIVATLLAAYAGILVGYETTLQPTMGVPYTIKAFAAVIVGGMGSIWGTVIGAYLLGFLESFGIGLEINGMGIPAGYKDAFAYLLILVILLLRPQGLLRRRLRET